ncbi:Protein of unknown function [Gryllus bimaculatus]|nr:Protein of unknown function [Gryllus bimaculatus]
MRPRGRRGGRLRHAADEPRGGQGRVGVDAAAAAGGGGGGGAGRRQAPRRRRRQDAHRARGGAAAVAPRYAAFFLFFFYLVAGTGISTGRCPVIDAQAALNAPTGAVSSENRLFKIRLGEPLGLGLGADLGFSRCFLHRRHFGVGRFGRVCGSSVLSPCVRYGYIPCSIARLESSFGVEYYTFVTTDCNALLSDYIF